jgi:hypothetical protein
MDWQTLTAVVIAAVAALWAGKLLVLPWIREFQKKTPADGGCCGCGTKIGNCGAPAKKSELN